MTEDQWEQAVREAIESAGGQVLEMRVLPKETGEWAFGPYYLKFLGPGDKEPKTLRTISWERAWAWVDAIMGVYR